MKINQAISGYDNGHRVLASSMPLSRSAERTIAIQSDLSGSVVRPQFDAYLTVYPIEDAKLIAIARTWYAYEEKRPGCVWTHTFLLGEGERQPLPLFELLDCFRRPQGKTFGFSDYEQPLSLPANSSKQVSISESESQYLQILLSTLFSDESPQLLVPAVDASEFEKLALLSWWIQWPTLRRHFAFSTGSLSNRSLANRGFDLQFVPVDHARHIARENKLARVLDVHQSHRGMIDAWATELVQDMEREGWVPQIEQIRLVSNGVPDERRFFPVLATMACSASQVISAAEAIEALYPGGHEGINTKSSFILAAFNSQSHDSSFGQDRSELIRTLVGPQVANSFSALEETAEQLGTELVNTNSEMAFGILSHVLQPQLNAVGIGVVKGILGGLDVGHFASVISQLRDELPFLVSLYPQIALSESAWEGTRRQQYEVCEAIGQCGELTSDYKSGVVFAALAADAHDVASSLIRTLGSDSLRFVLTWFNESKAHSPLSLHMNWRRELALNPKESIDWLRQSDTTIDPMSLALISEYIEPSDRGLLCVPIDVWRATIDMMPPSTTDVVAQKAIAFIFALAFHARETRFAEIAVRTFECIHNQMLNRELGYEEWQWISNDVPSLGWGWNWDRAERLRRGLIARFADSDWPLQLFPECVSTSDNWQMLYSSCRATEQGRHLMARLSQELAIEFPDE